MEKNLIYNHPSVPPKNIIIGSLYSLEDLEKIYSADDIKYFFKKVEIEDTTKVKTNKNIK